MPGVVTAERAGTTEAAPEASCPFSGSCQAKEDKLEVAASGSSPTPSPRTSSPMESAKDVSDSGEGTVLFTEWFFPKWRKQSLAGLRVRKGALLF